METTFCVYGKPEGKARPRVTIHGTYTPKKTKQYEQAVQVEYKRQSGVYFDNKQLTVMIDAYYPIPKNTSKAKRKEMLSGNIRPVTRPDIDNCCKSIMDALNGIAWKDDAQIVTLLARKFYDETPRVEVRISGGGK